MVGRDPDEPHRVASSFELFFDLVFVVAISAASGSLHHLESEAHLAAGIGGYLVVFFAIWWAWMNFSWFASAFDPDDWLYRVTTIFQMGGVLVLAAGASRAILEDDLRLVVAGYVIMRLAMVSQWLRAARSIPECRDAALRYALGITITQIGWVAIMFVDTGINMALGLPLIVAELAVPTWVERAHPTPWHTHHIDERYSLFTLIVLGESLLASSGAIIGLIDTDYETGSLSTIATCGLLTAAGMWWIYFGREGVRPERSLGSVFRFGYVHFVVFLGAASLSAGIEVALDYETHHTGIDAAKAALAFTVPVGIFIISTWFVKHRPTLPMWANVTIPVFAVLTVVTAFAPQSLILATIVVALTVVVLEVAPDLR